MKALISFAARCLSTFSAALVLCLVLFAIPASAAPSLPAPENQDFPAISSDGVDFLVVWLDRRSHAGAGWTECDVYAARISSTGQVLDPGGILVGTNSMWASPPAVAFDGTNYLVVWAQPDYFPIRGSRVSRTGQVLDGSGGFQIGESTGLMQTDPALAFNGSVFFVAWNDWRNQTNGTPNNLICDVYGARVTSAGEVLDKTNIPVVRQPSWQTSPAVAAIGNSFLVVWQDDYNIGKAQVEPSGLVIPLGDVSTGIRGGPARPVLAAIGQQYLCAWDEGFSPDGTNASHWIAGARLDLSGHTLDGVGFNIQTNRNGINYRLAIAASPADWFLGWLDHQPDPTAAGFWGGESQRRRCSLS